MSYKDKEWLRENYKENTVYEMADKAGVSKATILRWMDKHGLERDTPDRSQAEGPYKDEEWLRGEYVHNKRSPRAIADECDVSKRTINYWIEKHGIPKRDKSEAAKIRVEQHPHTTGNAEQLHPTFYDRRGYVIVKCGVNDEHVEHHRLLATLLVDDLDELDNKHVHHKNGVPWLNYLDELEVLTPAEHTKVHEPHLHS